MTASRRFPAPSVLKGGYALELRIKEARATRDLPEDIAPAFTEVAAYFASLPRD